MSEVLSPPAVAADAGECRSVREVLARGALSAVFQPIVSLGDAVVHAHEGLIRGPALTRFHSPEVLLQAAAAENCLHVFEVECVKTVLAQWRLQRQPGRLFVNLSASTLVYLLRARGSRALLDFLAECAMAPRNLVLELTEHERVTDMAAFAEVAAQVHATGVALALDDFGDGRSSLRLWSQIKPEVVKIDKYFARDISVHADKLKTLQALQQLAEVFDSTLVAEGIETEADLRVLRDLGLPLGQGYFLGRPQVCPLEQPNAATLALLRDRRVAVMPQSARQHPRGTLRHLAYLAAPGLGRDANNDTVARAFAQAPELHALPVLDGARPVGIINRVRFMNEYTKLYYREVWGRKPCTAHINFSPRVIERSHRIEELVGILTSQDQRYLHDGFIVTENGRYLGVGRGEELVRSVTESRIEAARHANPLTFLPGNIPISQHMQRLLRNGASFVACYADLNHFKPFNDHYGYWRGDEMIRLFARLAEAHCDAQRDFLGHVGGDDFVLLFQSSDWRQRCEQLAQAFAAQAGLLFDESARLRGGIEAEDRYGVQRFFPCTTVSIGAVPVRAGEYHRAEDLANAAALAKGRAKGELQGLWVQEQTVPA
ncbi:MAG: EAL domain-containing protein [Rhodoferax sp.]